MPMKVKKINPYVKEVGAEKTPIIVFVVTTPFAVNAFLANHIIALSENYRILLCTNLNAYSLLPSLLDHLEVHNIGFSRKIALLSDLSALLELWAVIRQVKPTVIHSLTPKAGLLAMLVGFLNGVPHRWHTFTGQLWITRNGINRKLLQAMDGLIVLTATQVFADSASQRTLLESEKVVKEGQINLLGFGSIAGVDFKRFHPDFANRKLIRKELGSTERACVFLFVGRLVKDKGVFDLLQAFTKLNFSESEAELWIVGPDEDGLLGELKKNTTGCIAPIRWLGSTTTPEHFMSASDVLVLPSYREGFGSVLIEAAACGIPTIAYKIPGVIDAVVDEFSGILVDVGEPAAFALAMRRLSLDKDLRHLIGHQARERVIRYFSSELVTKAWLEYYSNQMKKTS